MKIFFINLFFFITSIFGSLNAQSFSLENIGENYTDAMNQGTQTLLKEQKLKDTEAQLLRCKTEYKALLEVIKADAKFSVQLIIDNLDIEVSRRAHAELTLQDNIKLFLQKQAEIRTLEITIWYMQADLKKSRNQSDLALTTALTSIYQTEENRNISRLGLLQQMTNSARSSYTRDPNIRWNPAFIQTNLNFNFEKFEPNRTNILKLRDQLTNWASVELKKKP